MQKINAIPTQIDDIPSTLAPFFAFEGLKFQYPKKVIQALKILYLEYNRAFEILITNNREWETDYRFCFSGKKEPFNHIVQIDMVGLTQKDLSKIDKWSQKQVTEFIRSRIFELENSWALYHPLSSVIGSQSLYSRKTRLMLNQLRKKHNRPIVLLAATEEKYQAMAKEEFGVLEGKVPDELVYQLTGFNAFFGPDDFINHLDQNNGKCKCLLFCRTSDPLRKIKNPGEFVEHPLLSKPKLRRIIKAHSITCSIDDPEWGIGNVMCINDNKWYLPTIGMSYLITNIDDLYFPDLALHLKNEKPYKDFNRPGPRISTGLKHYLISIGVKPEDVESGKVRLRAKPAQATYGCYGHERGFVLDSEFRKKVKKGLRERGPYVIQVEHETPLMFNIADQKTYGFIDRVFFGMIGEKPTWMGGHRESLPYSSHEVESGRLHGNGSTIYAEIC